MLGLDKHEWVWVVVWDVWREASSEAAMRCPPNLMTHPTTTDWRRATIKSTTVSEWDRVEDEEWARAEGKAAGDEAEEPVTVQGHILSRDLT